MKEKQREKKELRKRSRLLSLSCNHAIEKVMQEVKCTRNNAQGILSERLRLEEEKEVRYTTTAF